MSKWIELDEDGGRLLDLDTISCVRLDENDIPPTIRYWEKSSNQPYEESYDTKEEAINKFNKVRKLLQNESEDDT